MHIKCLVLSTLAASALASHATHADVPLGRRGLHHRAADALKKLYMLSIDDKTPTVDDSPAASVTETVADSEVYSSTAIWYPSDGQEGACGIEYSDYDYVVGLSTALWRHAGRISTLCGQKVQVSMRGRSVVALVGDASGNNYTTLSKAAYGQLQNLTTGMIDITFVLLPNNTRLQTPAIQSPTASPAASPTQTLNAGAVRSSVANARLSSRSALSASLLASADGAASEASAQGASTTAGAKAASVAAASASESAAEASASVSAAAAAKASVSAAAAAKASESAAAAKASAKAAKVKADAAEAEQEAEDEAKAKAAAAAAAKAKADKAKADAEENNDDGDDDDGDDNGSSSGGGGSGEIHKGGFATFYSQNGVTGNCGSVAQDSDKVIALPTAMYSGGSHCGQKIVITRVSNGAQVTATVRDSCPTCVNNECLDLSVGAFTEIATEEEGMVAITWQWA
ncbi:BQ5605_C013g07209 [Microbotryum silenes-dioicae]|uniref:BQ5605_C013g07209 protein n=1 Tax=Microbotryum silenes-dioicae TaxID=796604 RepID=A0A2X0LVT7_9BASI|nr:BQ5605_C013g07209 [Microbotryum silenes-dioicae]